MERTVSEPRVLYSPLGVTVMMQYRAHMAKLVKEVVLEQVEADFLAMLKMRGILDRRLGHQKAPVENERLGIRNQGD